MSTLAINTNVRLFDLVRYMRKELHAADLITDDEYSWLCVESDMANSPKGGSPSPRRLEDYDKIRADNAALRANVRDFINHCANGDFYAGPVATGRRLLGDRIDENGMIIAGEVAAARAALGKEKAL